MAIILLVKGQKNVTPVTWTLTLCVYVPVLTIFHILYLSVAGNQVKVIWISFQPALSIKKP